MKKLKLLLIVFILLSCKRGFNSETELYKWTSDPRNGLVKSHEHADIFMKVRYLPQEYLIYNEVKKVKNYSKRQIDSLTEAYEKTIAFLFTLEFKHAHAGDNSLLQGVADYQEYRERIDKLNFHLDDYFSLNCGDSELKPLLWTLENNYTAGNKKNLYIVFKKLEDSVHLPKELDLVFNDEIFYTGTNHFVFNRDQLKSVPAINFWKFEQ